MHVVSNKMNKVVTGRQALMLADLRLTELKKFVQNISRAARDVSHKYRLWFRADTCCFSSRALLQLRHPTQQ